MDDDNAQLSTFPPKITWSVRFVFFHREENPLDIALDGSRLLRLLDSEARRCVLSCVHHLLSISPFDLPPSRIPRDRVDWPS